MTRLCINARTSKQEKSWPRWYLAPSSSCSGINSLSSAAHQEQQCKIFRRFSCGGHTYQAQGRKIIKHSCRKTCTPRYESHRRGETTLSLEPQPHLLSSPINPPPSRASSAGHPIPNPPIRLGTFQASPAKGRRQKVKYHNSPNASATPKDGQTDTLLSHHFPREPPSLAPKKGFLAKKEGRDKRDGKE